MLSQQPTFPSSGPQGLSADATTTLPFLLDPNTAKQMAALQATSLAKSANRSAPGGVTSASYFGGLSAHQLSRPDSSSSSQEPNHFSFSGLPNSQAQGPSANVGSARTPLSPSRPAQTMFASQPQMNIAAMQQQQHQQNQFQRKRQFLTGLASIMQQRGTPLPPNLTGLPYPPNYDPSTSPWRTLEVSNSDLGVVRLAGKDIDLFRLWAVVQQAGSGQKLSQTAGWGQLLSHFDLPEQFTQSNGQQQPTALALQQYFAVLLGPFEEIYRKNMMRERAATAARNQAVQMPGGQGRVVGLSGMPGTFPPVGTLPAISGHNGLGMIGQPMGGGPAQSTDPSFGGINGVPFSGSQVPPMSQHQAAGSMNGIQSGPDMAALNGIVPTASQAAELNASTSEQDLESRKRKLEDGEEGKRVKHKSGDSSDLRGSLPPSGLATQSNMSVSSRPLRQPSRRKIEYIPLAREIETAGGRDLDAIVHELNLSGQRALKDLSEWGTVDVEALMLSLRSRIATELSYALTTFTVISLIRWKETGFAVAQAPDLFEELLDLAEETAFGEPEEDKFTDDQDTAIITHRHLVDTILEEDRQPFAGLKPKQGAKDPSSGIQQRPGDIILCIMVIIRNLSMWPDNLELFSKHGRLLSIILRLCSVKSDLSSPTPLSPVLTLSDLVQVRKDTVAVLLNIAGSIHFPARSVTSPSLLRDARRAFNLLASYIVDPNEALPPFQCIQRHGPPTPTSSLKPPSAIDNALEVFTRLSHPDDNRLVFARAVPQASLWAMIEALVHRLPVTDHDFTVIVRQEWLAYLERTVLALYSLAFLAPPKVKKRVKSDRQLAFPTVMLRLIRKLILGSPVEHRGPWSVTVRRAVETIKLIDDAGDSFDSSSATVPTLSFGMGYGEHGESRVEKGMGLLSGHQEEVTWGLMMQREILSDDILFSELVSLVRIQPTA